MNDFEKIVYTGLAAGALIFLYWMLSQMKGNPTAQETLDCRQDYLYLKIQLENCYRPKRLVDLKAEVKRFRYDKRFRWVGDRKKYLGELEALVKNKEKRFNPKSLV